MPTNLPAEAIKADKLYRAAKTSAEKIVHLQAYLSAIPKHKGTDKLQADLKSRISKLKKEIQQKKKAARRGDQFFVDKEGAAQVVLSAIPCNTAVVTTLTQFPGLFIW